VGFLGILFAWSRSIMKDQKPELETLRAGEAHAIDLACRSRRRVNLYTKGATVYVRGEWEDSPPGATLEGFADFRFNIGAYTPLNKGV
jgi:hypothetical protein